MIQNFEVNLRILRTWTYGQEEHRRIHYILGVHTPEGNLVRTRWLYADPGSAMHNLLREVMDQQNEHSPLAS